VSNAPSQTGTEQSQSGAPQPKRSAAAFFLRLVSTTVLWVAMLLGVFYAPPLVFYLALTAIACVALWEFYNIVDAAGLRCYRRWGLAACAALLMGSWFFFEKGVLTPKANAFTLCVFVVFILGAFLRQFPQKHNPHPIETMACTLFGLLYVPWLLSFITLINFSFLPADATREVWSEAQRDGRFFVLYLVMVTKFTDVGSYVFGMTMGKHKLIPRISPNKTWEGVYGGIVGALVASYAGWHLMRTPLERNGLDFVDATILGVLLGAVAIVGDLAESLVKRQANIKDSGKMLPGIGGALDLVDSLLFTAPVLYVYMRLVMM
jgi:phosphatidate cytidylyltransferase